MINDNKKLISTKI